jgi:hypothetical protein
VEGLDVLARSVAVSRDRCQPLTHGGAQYHAYRFELWPPPKQMAKYCIPRPSCESSE